MSIGKQKESSKRIQKKAKKERKRNIEQARQIESTYKCMYKYTTDRYKFKYISKYIQYKQLYIIKKGKIIQTLKTNKIQTQAAYK